MYEQSNTIIGGRTGGSPDFANRESVLTGEGQWTALNNGYIQFEAAITHPAQVFAIFSITINGVIA